MAVGPNLQDRMDPKVKRIMLRAQAEILHLQRRDMKANQQTESDEALEHHEGLSEEWEGDTAETAASHGKS